MKSSIRLVILALTVGTFQHLFAQPASEDQIEAARQYLRTGRFGAPRSPAGQPSIRTNAVRNPGSTMRYGTRPPTAPTAPGATVVQPNALSPDQERESRRVLSDMRSLKPEKATSPANPVAGTPVVPTPAPVVPTATVPAVTPTPLPQTSLPVATTPAPVVPAAPPIVATPTPPPALVATPIPAVTPENRPDQEMEALRLLEEYKRRGSPEQAEALRIQNEIKAAKTAQETRAATAKSQEEIERMKEIARIEAEVLRAKARREGTPEAALPPVTPAPSESVAVPPASIPATPAPAVTTTIPSIPSPASMPSPVATIPPATPPPATIPAPSAYTPPPVTATIPPPTTPTPPVATPPPAYNPPPIAPVEPVTPIAAESVPPSATTVPNASAAPFRPSSHPQMRATLTPDMELKARELLNQQTAAISPPVVPPNLTSPATESARPNPNNDAAARRAAAEAQAKREALEWERQRQQNRTAPAATAVPPSASTTTPTSPTSPASRSTGPVAPLSAPMSAAKQTRLEELGAAYKADKITAAQYHAERARILAEP